MAQLKDLIVNGASRFIGDIFGNKAQLTALNAPTAAGGTTYGPGTSGQVLKTNGTSIYWGTDNNSGGTVTSVQVQATSPVVSSTNTAQTGTLNTTISLANNYGDTKNPYASKTQNYVLAAPPNANGVPSFRALVAADIPDLDTYLKKSGGTMTGALTLSGAPTADLHAATKKYVDDAFAANDAMIFKGTISGGSTDNYGALTPAANRGWTYKVDTAGEINGVAVEIGDVLICLDDNTAAATASDYDTAQTHWVIVQNNVDGAVFKSSNSFTDSKVIIADGTSGKVKTSEYTIGASIETGTAQYGIAYYSTTTNITSTTQGTNGALLTGKGTSAPAWTASADGAVYATSANGDLQWGTLPIAQGGTGNTSYTANRLIYSESTSQLSAHSNLITGTAITYAGRSITPTLRVNSVLYTDDRVEAQNYFLVNKGSKGASYYLYSNNAQYGRFWVDTIGTANSGDGNATRGTRGETWLYVGNDTPLPAAGTAGGENNARGSVLIYGESNGYVRLRQGEWYGSNLSVISGGSTTANTAHYSYIYIGNANNVSSTSSHTEGRLRIYSAATHYHEINGQSTTTAYTHTLPNANGTIAQLGDMMWNTIGTALPDNANLNTYNETGSKIGLWYSDRRAKTETLGTPPFTSSGFRMIALKGYGITRGHQIVWGTSPTPYLRTEDGTANTYSAWSKLVYIQNDSNNANVAVGSSTQPVYVNSDGKVVAITDNIANGTTGNAATATVLATSRNINDTLFNGSADITTAKWGTARDITIGSTSKSVNGSADVSWSHAEIGATVSNAWTAGTTAGPTITTTVNGVASTAVAIPAAAAGASGVVTTAQQQFDGDKIFNGVVRPSATNTHSLGSSSYLWSTLYSNLVFSKGVGTTSYMAYPSDGIYGNASAQTVTGALCITLPSHSYTANVMVQFDVTILNYNSAENVTYHIHGYTSSAWGQTIVYSNGTLTTHRDLKVTFTDNGTNKQVIIGETDTTWSYPKVSITNVLYGAGSSTYAEWSDGWNISFVTTMPTATQSVVTKNAGTVYSAPTRFGFSSNSTVKYLLGATASDTSASEVTVSKVYANENVYLKSDVMYGAAWNDYAEFRTTQQNIEPGRCIKENGDDTLKLTEKRLERGCEIVSDTFGFAIGETEECQTPIASSGRVLAYPYEPREEFASHIGWPVCSGPSGTVSIMTEEEEEKYPSRIIGTISAVPDYEEWGTGNVKVNGRVWIRIR